jgi:uncharacterized membrane protein YfcA
LFGAGSLAGLTGTAGGITSLISYPALLAVGLSPLHANMTNAVAVLGNWPGSTYAARPELKGGARRLRQLVPFAVAGGVIGTVLLLETPGAIFDRAVPFFLVLASIALLCQPRLATWRRHYLAGASRYLFYAGLFCVCVYDGYFGAGSGVMLLALILIAVDEQFPRANAYKNFLLGVSDVIAAVGFAIFGAVDWVAACSVGAGTLLGGTYGPRLTRHLPADALRIFVALVGLGLAVKLFLDPT